MVRRFVLVIALLTAALQSYAARAETTPCPVVECRARTPFPNCDDAVVANPPSGTVGVVGTVVDAHVGRCGTGMSIDVIRSSQAALPPRITFDWAPPCLMWNGRPGDTIRILVKATPLPDGSYLLWACK